MFWQTLVSLCYPIVPKSGSGKTPGPKVDTGNQRKKKDPYREQNVEDLSGLQGTLLEPEVQDSLWVPLWSRQALGPPTPPASIYKNSLLSLNTWVLLDVELESSGLYLLKVLSSVTDSCFRPFLNNDENSSSLNLT